MNKLYFVLIIIILFHTDLGFSQPKKHSNVIEVPRDRILIQTIGIRYNGKDLHSASSLSQYRKGLAEKYIFPCYADNGNVFSLHGDTLSASIIESCLKGLEDEASSTDVVIIHIIGHGEYDESNDMYYLICSDGSKLSGDVLRNYITTMSGRGALVVIFLDTCHSGAFFKKGENGSLFGNNGGIALFAASQRKQDATDLGENKFTKTILKALETNKTLTLGTLANKLGEQYGNDSIEKEIDISTGQSPYAFFFPQNRELEHYKIQDYPIIREKIINSPVTSTTGESEVVINKSKAFLPWTVSPENGKGLDYFLIGVECASLIGMVVFSPLIQPNYQNKIDIATNPWERNDYRKKGKNAAIGFCASAGIFVASYLWRTIHVHKQISIYNEKSRNYAVTLDIMPNISYESNGLSLVLNF